MKARQNLKKRVARIEKVIKGGGMLNAEYDRLFDERQRLQERRGIVAAPFPDTSSDTQNVSKTQDK